MDVVEGALDAGLSANRHPRDPYGPIVAAIMVDHVVMVKFLLDRGADPNEPVAKTVPWPTDANAQTTPGERALHIAAKRGNVEIVNLLTRALADPDVTDDCGCTPLFSACQSRHVSVDIVRLLLRAGANPTLADKNGYTPLHLAAQCGHIVLFDVLFSEAPAMLNRCTAKGFTPLFVACDKGHEAMVSRLLSLRPMQPTPLNQLCECPLVTAIYNGSVGVVRVLINEGGIRAVGGEQALVLALRMAVQYRQAKILRLLLTAEGDKKRSAWADTKDDGFDRFSLLHYSTCECYPFATSVLLEAGADETALDSGGITAGDVVWHDLGMKDDPQRDPGRELAIDRMLQRGPAYRARSWVWPSHERADAGGRGDGDAAAAVLSPPKTSPVGVRIFRPKVNSSSRVFVRVVDRYCAKD